MVLQLDGERGNGAVEMALHGALGDAEGSGDLGDGEVGVEAKHDALPLASGQGG